MPQSLQRSCHRHRLRHTARDTYAVNDNQLDRVRSASRCERGLRGRSDDRVSVLRIRTTTKRPVAEVPEVIKRRDAAGDRRVEIHHEKAGAAEHRRRREVHGEDDLLALLEDGAEESGHVGDDEKRDDDRSDDGCGRTFHDFTSFAVISPMNTDTAIERLPSEKPLMSEPKGPKAMTNIVVIPIKDK